MVNTAPLESARLPPDIASILPLFPGREETIVAAGRHEGGHKNPSGIVEWVRLTRWVGWGLPGMNVEVRLYRSEGAAAADFYAQARDWKSVVRGAPGNLCAVSRWVRSRVGADAPFSCGHDLPSSFVIFQKGKIVVYIGETLDHDDPDADGDRKGPVIERLAEILSGDGP